MRACSCDLVSRLLGTLVQAGARRSFALLGVRDFTLAASGGCVRVIGCAATAATGEGQQNHERGNRCKNSIDHEMYSSILIRGVRNCEVCRTRTEGVDRPDLMSLRIRVFAAKT